MIRQLLFLLTFSGSVVLAQPSLTSVGLMPVTGDIFKIHTTAHASPGSAGANQTWNFSTLTSTGSKSYTVGLPGATPHATDFPNATLQMNNGTDYEFWSSTAADMSVEGIVQGTAVQPNSDPEKLFQFPINFNDNYTDTWGGTFVLSGFNVTRTATTTVTYDGYGTLTTPAATFPNAVRLHVVQNINDASIITITRQYDEYRWYVPGYHAPVMTVYTRTSSVSSNTLEATYLEVSPSTTVGVTEFGQGTSGVVAYPNPASEVAHIKAIQDRATTLEFYDFQGRLIYSEIVPEGNSPVKIDVKSLADGLYFARVKTANGRIETKKIWVRH